MSYHFSKALVTIKTDCDLPVGLDDLARSTPDNDKLTLFYTDLELNQFLRQLSSAPPDNLCLSRETWLSRDFL